MSKDDDDPIYFGVNNFGSAVFRFHTVNELGEDKYPYVEFDRDQLLDLQRGVLDALTNPKLGQCEPGDES